VTSCRWTFCAALPLVVLSLGVAFMVPKQAWAQGETTSSILGQVTDSSNALIPGATVTITNVETGLTRSVKTDTAGRFNFPQLQPGTYSVRVQAQGFDPQRNDNVVSSLGQKQNVNVVLKVAQERQVVEVESDAPIINPENANTSTSLSAPALENLPNPGKLLFFFDSE
jgi:hypothetical protein